MDHGQLAVVSRIAVALLIGGIIGLERTFHGRPAGFRTHSLVSVAAALLMLRTVYQSDWMTATPLEAIRTDPTRVAQGINRAKSQMIGAGNSRCSNSNSVPQTCCTRNTAVTLLVDRGWGRQAGIPQFLFSLVRASAMPRYTEIVYSIKKVVGLTAEMAERIRDFQFKQRIDS